MVFKYRIKDKIFYTFLRIRRFPDIIKDLIGICDIIFYIHSNKEYAFNPLKYYFKIKEPEHTVQTLGTYYVSA